MHQNVYFDTTSLCLQNMGAIQLSDSGRSETRSFLILPHGDFSITDIQELAPTSGNAADSGLKLTEISLSDATVEFPTVIKPEYETISVQFNQNSAGNKDQYTGTYLF